MIGVLLYHADITWAKGGFIGVDMFFVLSGYLVTSIIVAGFAKTGGLDLRRFWSGRFRRLMPAQIALIVVITLAMAVFYRDELSTLPGQVLAALTGTMNWYLLATEGSYFEQLGRAPVFRHLWSLAIELQFYLAFPPILIACLKRWPDRLDRIVLGLAVAVLASATYMAVIYDPNSDPTRVYFDTFARLMAPLLGAILALVWRPWALRRGEAARLGAPATAVGVAAMAALIWMMYAVSDLDPFMYRGGFLLTAILSTLLVAAIVHPSSAIGGQKALGHPVLVAIGLRSYGLYLWHWPVFDLIRPRIDVGWSWGLTFVVRMVVTIALTEACYRLVEQPWHQRQASTTFAGMRARLANPMALPMSTRVAQVSAVLAALAATVVLVVPHEPTDTIGESLREGEAAVAALAESEPVVTTSTTTEPGAPTTTVVPGTARVTLVGDSVMLGAAPNILEGFGPRANMDAKVSRQAGDLAPIVAQMAVEGRLNDNVVVQVGINGTVTEDELRAISDAADGRRLFVVNARVPRSWEAGNNATVERVVPELEQAEVIDWYSLSNGKRDWFLDDGVHLTETGREAYATFIRESVDAT